MKNKFSLLLCLSMLFFFAGAGAVQAQKSFKSKTPNLKILYPDLIIKSVAVSTDKQKITVIVANVCEGRSKPTTVRLAFRQRDSGDRGQIKFAVSGEFPALRANQETGEIVLDISGFAGGQDLTNGNDIFSVELVVDPLDTVKELDETNNSAKIYTHSAPAYSPEHCDRRT